MVIDYKVKVVPRDIKKGIKGLGFGTDGVPRSEGVPHKEKTESPTKGLT